MATKWTFILLWFINPHVEASGFDVVIPEVDDYCIKIHDVTMYDIYVICELDAEEAAGILNSCFFLQLLYFLL